MINRENWIEVKAYLRYLTKVRQQDEQTVKKRRSQLRHLLEWCDQRSFERARSIDPTFPAYLLTARNDGKEGLLSAESLKSSCEVARRFFEWLKMVKPRKYGGVSSGWIDTLRPSRSRGMQSVVHEHQFYTYAEILKVAALQPDTLRKKRDQAAMAFMFVSGIRAGAFISLPADCVDVKNRRVYQVPARGVRTKNDKAAITSMLPIPELIKVVDEWDRNVRENAPAGSAWYAHLNPRGGGFCSRSEEEISDGRSKILARGMKIICDMAGIRYLSPHKERHGHAVFALQHVRDMAGLKAVSMNLMHSSVAITDGVYGTLTNDDAHEIIEGLSPDSKTGSGDGELLKKLLDILKENPALLGSGENPR